MKIGLYVEGADDGAFYPALLERVLNIGGESILTRIRRGQCVRGLKQQLKSVLAEFRQQGCTHIVLCADQHEATAAERTRLSEEAAGMVEPLPCTVGVAVRQLEAWLLADYRCVATILERLRFDQPPDVEELQDPKHYLATTIGRPNARQLGEIARTMDLDRARRQARSLHRFLSDLERWR